MASTDLTASEHANVAVARYKFLREQLAALCDMRQEGHFSDIVEFASGGLQSTVALIGVMAPGQERVRLAQLQSEYERLLQSLVH
jgi:hypothetical protein